MFTVRNTWQKKLLSFLLALMFTAGIALPAGLAPPALAADELTQALEQPVLLVTGMDIIGGGYTASSVSNERSYTLAELQNLGITDTRYYSSLNSAGTKRIYMGEGADAASLLALSDYTADTGGELTFFASDGYTVKFDSAVPLNEGRQYFPNLGMAEGEDEGAEAVGTLLAWQSGYVTAPGVPETMAAERPMRLLAGQTDLTNVNNSLFNQQLRTIQAGDAVAEAAINILDTDYTRAEILMMPRAERAYGSTTVRGVPLSVLLNGLSDSAVIEFHTADDYDVAATGMTKAELIAANALLVYETLTDSVWTGYYRAQAQTGTYPAYFRLYADGLTAAHAIDAVSERPVEASAYKHMDYDGAPYHIDAITGATLTVEGPGVVASVPITVEYLEKTTEDNIHKGVYSDSRGSGSVAFSYEGVTLQSILDGQVNSIVERLDDSVVVVFKNRWREEMGRISYADILSADTPLIMAYGTASADETSIPPRPFVFNMGAGESAALGNGDGPLKLVYDQDEFPGLAAKSAKFYSVAYLYIEEGTPPPGFKHTTATNEAYSNKLNTEYIVTFTGDALGREVNYTVAELEAMVEYEDGAPAPGGKGHRDNYNLSNTTYWYVNEYEGVKVWDLLVGMGVDPAKYANDEDTLVSFSSWDNYLISAQFSMYQLANPGLFYFYEKSPLDIGTDRPTKEQLATAEYQPDNREGDGWVLDDNGYPVKKGYPVLLAYGLNGYPYVRNPGMNGYMSGLGNSGGPMRVIYGKTDGLNRSNPDAEENYAYFFNNGSQQLQRVQEVYVGNPLRYSTHLENPLEAYQAMKDQSAALTVEVVSAGVTTPYTFSLAELESILYGEGVSKRDRDTEGRQEKGYYTTRIAGTNPIHELYEGINLEYLLTEYIGLQGTLGTVEMYSGDGAAPESIYSLADIGEKGYNAGRGTEGLGMMVAFAKNGFPLVDGPNSTANPNPGYVHNDPLDNNKGIRNGVGPLHFVRPQTADERVSNTVNGTTGDAKTLVENLTRIVVNLDPDPYAHTGAANEEYANQELQFNGAIAFASGVNLPVGVLETMQKYMVTDTYTVDGVTNTYRGLDLFRLLNDKSVGASALMDEITVANGEGQSKSLTVADLTGVGKKVILAYGMAGAVDTSDAAPLTTDTGGPIRLVIDGGDGDDCISGVTEISVSAASLDGWKHTSGNFAEYATDTLEISGQNLKSNKTYTVAEIEDMDNILVFDQYQVGGPTWVQGIDLYKLLQNIGFAGDLDTSAFTANSIDNYPITFTGAQLKDGINGKPILVAYGMGTSQTNGLPLVPLETSPGYDPNVFNSSGPLRLIVHDNTGWCVKWLTKITVGASGGTEEPVDELDFNIYGLSGGTVSYDIRGLKNSSDFDGKAVETYSYASSGNTVTDTVRGAYLYDILKANGVSDASTVTVNTTDSFESSGRGDDYCDITMAEIKDMKYFVAYDAGSDADSMAAIADVRNEITATVRIYRNYSDPPARYNRMTDIKGVTVAGFAFNLYPGGVDGVPQASVRAVVADEAGGIWLGTNGAGMAYISPEGGVTKYSTATTPALKTDFVTGIAIAPDGGVWLTQGGSVGSQNAPPSAHYGFACFKDGAFTFYDSTTEGSTLPSDCIYGLDVDKDGLVWLTSQHTLLNGGMEGGLTRFDPASGEWRSWTMADGLPTMSAWAVKADNQGGAWVTTYRTSNVDDVAWPNQSYAHVSAAGFVTAYSIPAGIDFNWSRSVSVDPEGGVYITRMSGAHDPANDGGWLDYIAPGGGVTSYKGDDLIPDLKAKARQGFYPEIRTVFVDAAGDLWLSTNGLGVFRCAVSDGAITVTDNYWSGSGSWPAGAFDDVWSMYVSPEGLACFGSNGGLATAQVELGGGDEPDPQPVVLDPPFTIKGWGGGEIAWIVGGSGAGNPIKSMPNDAGRAEKDYSYDGQLRRVRGAMLIDILAASGVSGDNVLVSINTTDGFSRDNYKDISLEDVAAKNYFVAYDIYNIETDAWDKVADVDRNNVQASLRIYRDEDAGATGERNNEIKGLSGITISQADDGDGDGDDPNPDPNDSVVLTVIDGDILVKEFTKSEIDLLPKKNNNYSAYNTNPTYRTYSNVSGVDIWNLLAGAGLAPEDDSEITFFASDGFSTTLKISDLTTARYFFSSDGVRGDQVPPVISFDSSGGRLYFGQLAAQEQTAFAFAQMINRIVIGGTAGTNGTPVADPPSGSTVNEGDPIVLSTPSGSGNAKIYYTLDGSTPDMDSPMYNISGQDANPPLYVPEGLAGGTFTITARIIGLGRFDGDIVTFTYDVAEPVAEAIRITFNTNGGSVSPASMLTGADGKLTSLPTPTRGGYIFAGWFTAAAGGNRVTTDTVFTGDATIHAQWYDDYEHPEGILAVYNGSVLAKDLSQSDIDELPISTNDYSTLSTFPTYESIDGISGVSVISLLAAAGLSPDDGREITFIGSDGFSSTLKIGDLTATRYHFSEEGVRGTAVPPVINFDNTGGRLYFGQLTAQEQTRFAFVGQIDRIVVGGVAGAFGEPTANPASGSTVKKGGEIRLDLPEGAGRAKIYYTLDGSAPTMLSAIYNVSAYVANPPILVPKDYPEEEFTITAQIIGLGRYPGSIVEFTYTVESGAAVGEDMGDGDTPTAGIPGPGAATVVIEANAVPLGDMPVLPFDKVELSEKIQEAIAADGDKILELKINAAPTATSIDAKVPTDSIKEMVDAGLRYLVISSPLGSNSYDLAALTSIAGQAEGNNFDFIIRVVDPDTLDEGLQAVVGSNDVFEILVLRGDTEITSFGAGLAVTRINYALKPGQSAYGLKVWHVGADGKLTEIACTYNSTLGYVEFIRNSHSYYMVGYDAEAAEWTDNPFLDVNPGDWFYDNVRFAFARGLMTGVADDRFGPNMTLTRGMVVTVLHRIAGSPATAVANPFGDVPVGEWYADAVAWAASKGVVAGYGDGAFGPEDDITREQMAAILANYEAFSGRIPPAVTDDRDFADAGDIGGWAKDAVDKLARQGIIGGKPGNLFDPKGNATRAEFAAILQRFLEAE